MNGKLLEVSVYWFPFDNAPCPLVIMKRWGQEPKRYTSVSSASMKRLTLAVNNKCYNRKPNRGKVIPMADGWLYQAF